MAFHDFKALNDKEFEVFCADLIGAHFGQRFERFKPGRDGGIDGRFFAPDGAQTVLQCKHWHLTNTNQLIRYLKTQETAKVIKLAPKTYILAISKSLSAADKDKICKAMSPCLRSPSDIFGLEDLNDLLNRHPNIEQRHYKLWLTSAHTISHFINAPILGRSRFKIKEIIENLKNYAETINHAKGLNILDKQGTLVITGEPGIGKTTLAENLCLFFIAKGFSFQQIEDDIKEAEGVFDENIEQIFYFDDFLGRNYIEALTGNRASHIVNFIKRVSSSPKTKFILTSRSTILNQGKVLNDVFNNNNIQRHEFELKISSLRPIDKAKILYNHIYNSRLDEIFISEIYKSKRYIDIIDHRNFNPRLIAFITDPERLKLSHTEYWPYILAMLENPSDIWANPYESQQDDFSRAMILLVVLNGRPISEKDLCESYENFITRPEKSSMQGRRDFLINAKHLSGSFLKRNIASDSKITYDLFSPSIGDYILNRYSNYSSELSTAFCCLKTAASLSALTNMYNSSTLSRTTYLNISTAMLNSATSSNLETYNPSYISGMLFLFSNINHNINHNTPTFQAALKFLTSNKPPAMFEQCAKVFAWAYKNNLINTKELLYFFESVTQTSIIDDELLALSDIYLILKPSEYGSQVTETFHDLVIEHISSQIDNFVDDSELFDSVDFEDYAAAEEAVRDLISDMFIDLGLKLNNQDFQQIIKNYDIDRGLDNHYYNKSSPSRKPTKTTQKTIDSNSDIHDLFEQTNINQSP